MLPQIAIRKYSLELPSQKKPVEFRPFIIAENKLLAEARMMDDKNMMYRRIADVLAACTFNKIDIGNLPMYEIDLLFLNIKSKSSGEIIPLVYTCSRKTCQRQTPVNINVTDASIKGLENGKDYKQIVFLNQDQNAGITLRPPSFDHFLNLDQQSSDSDVFASLTYSIIENIFDEKNSYLPGKDYTVKELAEFIDQQEEGFIKIINKYIEELPYVSLTMNIVCPHCQNEETIEVKDIESFFD